MNDFNQLAAFQIQMFPYEQLRPDMAEEDYVICVDAQKHSGNITDFVGDEVEVAVVFSKRGDGIKFSVRSEDPAVHAGHLVRDALHGYGDGGGHAELAGGMIRKEKECLLGRYPKDTIRDSFLRVLS